jgi:Rho GDP-dissociation inhibitor
MLGSYGPHPKGEAYIKTFDTEESPSGMIARSGTYNVRSRVVDDDKNVYAGTLIQNDVKVLLFMLYMNRLDWEWYFKLAKEW